MIQGTNHSLQVISINNTYTIISIKIQKPSTAQLQHYTDNMQVSGNFINFKGQTCISISYKLLLIIFAMQATWEKKCVQKIDKLLQIL